MGVSGLPPLNTVSPNQPIVNPESGLMLSQPYIGFFAPLISFLQSVQAALGPVLGVNSGLFTAIPTLGAGDAGYVYFITDLRHLIYWDGAAWQYLDGDQPGRFSHFIAAPGTGWVLCDGSATTYLSVGAVPALNAITLPDLTTAAYLKSGAAGSYTGTPVAAAAPGATMSGSTATGSTGTGSTGTGTTGDGTGQGVFNASTGLSADLNFTTHHHSVPALSVPSLSIPALGAGTLAATVDATADPRHLIAPVYFRR